MGHLLGDSVISENTVETICLILKNPFQLKKKIYIKNYYYFSNANNQSWQVQIDIKYWFWECCAVSTGYLTFDVFKIPF